MAINAISVILCHKTESSQHCTPSRRPSDVGMILSAMICISVRWQEPHILSSRYDVTAENKASDLYYRLQNGFLTGWGDLGTWDLRWYRYWDDRKGLFCHFDNADTWFWTQKVNTVREPAVVNDNCHSCIQHPKPWKLWRAIIIGTSPYFFG